MPRKVFYDKIPSFIEGRMWNGMEGKRLPGTGGLNAFRGRYGPKCPFGQEKSTRNVQNGLQRPSRRPSSRRRGMCTASTLCLRCH